MVFCGGVAYARTKPDAGAATCTPALDAFRTNRRNDRVVPRASRDQLAAVVCDVQRQPCTAVGVYVHAPVLEGIEVALKRGEVLRMRTQYVETVLQTLPLS